MLFNKKNDEDPTPVNKYRKPDGAQTRSVIDPWLQITGNLEGRGELQIDGHVRGDIRCAHLVIGKDATVDGNITADEIVVRGTVNGVIRGNRVILQDGAVVHGEVFHRRLGIDEGALFEGTIRMSDNPVDELLAVAAEMKSATKVKANSSATKAHAACTEPLVWAQDDKITAAAAEVMAATETEADKSGNSKAPLGSEINRIRAQLRRPA
jgi:cytoskeletal protein CcmA (bactofilin family)